MQEPIVLIDINMLSARLSIPKGTLYNWVYQRRIPFIKAGRSLRFDAEEVIRSMPRYTKSEEPFLRSVILCRKPLSR